MTQIATKDRILDAAETLFARDGYVATSLRAITVEAEANVAAIHYHFGSKQSLLEALFKRRVAAINDERIGRLDAAEKGGAGTPSLDEVLRIFLEPALRRLGSDDTGWTRFTRVMGRVLGETGDHVHAIQQVFSEVRMRFVPALKRALPHLSPEDIAWRMHFLIGTMSFLLADPARLSIMTNGRCDASDSEQALAQMLAFVHGGFASPAAKPLSHAKDGA